ncbi:hypothetical protein, partial [Kordia sp.]|uniref:hypothetical protein n=1 Tax=Kordia sp. TaxID=1965332 RepID=UPI003D6BF315
MDSKKITLILLLTLYLISCNSKVDSKDTIFISLPPFSIQRFVGIPCYDDLKNSSQTFYHANGEQANI